MKEISETNRMGAQMCICGMGKATARGKELFAMIIRELTEKEALQMLEQSGLSSRSMPYRGYAVTIAQDHRTRTFIGHSPDKKYLLQRVSIEMEAA